MEIVALLILQLLVGYGLACVCFTAGIALGGWQFWLSLAAVLVPAWRRSPRTAYLLLGLNALMIVLTCFTFTYIHCDSAACHFPMSQFLQEGWNPVRDCSLEAVQAHYAAHGMTDAEDVELLFHSRHVLVGPKFTQILAAQLQSGLGLFTAAAYPLWMLAFALALVAYRTGRRILSLSPAMAAVFAAMLGCNPAVVGGSLMGQLDLVTYEATVIAALALVLWDRDRRPVELLVFFSAIVIMLVNKFNSLTCAILFLITAAVVGRKDRSMRLGFLFLFLSLIVFCTLPYWTNAYWFGSPFYPAHSFRPGVERIDLTADFTGLNEPARQMGYFSRTVFAWISPKLALWGCRIWYGSPDFMPYWKHDWMTNGAPWYVCIGIWSGFLALFTRRWSLLKVMAALLFLSFFLIPVRYIGYPRYVGQVHAAVILAWFTFAETLPEHRRLLVLKGCCAVAVVLVGTALVHFFIQFGTEAMVKRNIRRMQESGAAYALERRFEDSSYAYAVRERLRLDGLEVAVVPPGEEPEGVERMEMKWHMRLTGKGLVDIKDRPYVMDKFSVPGPLWR